PRLLAFRRAGARPADDRLRLAARAFAVRAHDGCGRVSRRAVRVRRRRDGVRERVQRAERQRRAGAAVRAAGGRARGRSRGVRARRPGLRRGALVRDAADRRLRRRRRSAGDGADRERDDPRRDPLSGAAAKGVVEAERRYALDALLDALGLPFDEQAQVRQADLDEIFGLLTLAGERDAERDGHGRPLPPAELPGARVAELAAELGRRLGVERRGYPGGGRFLIALTHDVDLLGGGG